MIDELFDRLARSVQTNISVNRIGLGQRFSRCLRGDVKRGQREREDFFNDVPGLVVTANG